MSSDEDTKAPAVLKKIFRFLRGGDFKNLETACHI